MAINGASLQPIYDRLNGVEEQNPGNAVTFSDWSMEAGDTVTITRDGKEYKSTVHTSTMVWKGKTPTVTINNNGEEARDSINNDSKKKFGRNGSSLRASENAYYAIETSYNNMTSGLILASSSAALYVDNKYTQMSAGLKLTSSSAALYVDNKYTQMSSGLKLTSSSAALYVDNKYTQMSAGLKLTSSSAALYVDNKYTQMSSGLKLTSSSAALYVDNKYTQMSSGLKLTSSSAALYVDNKYTQMSSGLKLTSSSAALYVDNKYTQMSSGLKLTSSSAALYVDNKYTQMSSGLKLTSSSAALYVDNKYTQMSSGLKLTSSSAALYVDNKYTQMSSGLKLTSSSAALYVDNKYTQMSSGLKLTSSSAALYVDNKYTQMSSGLKLTSSSAALYVDNKYTQMSSGLKLTSSSAALYVDNKYTQMSSGLKLTSSSAALYVDNKYTQMSSGLKLTSSSAALYVDNKYTQMSSGLKLTSSSAALYVDNKYTAMSSGLALTSSSAAFYVESKYSQMSSGLDVTMSSATLYAKNRTTRAYIMTRINADNEGEALIEADKVKITGTTKLNDVMTVTNNAVGFSKPAIFSNNVDINSTGELNVYTINLKGSTDVSIDKAKMATAIQDASVSGNTLTLTKFDGTVITFSKATSLSGEWSSGHLQVTASPQSVKYHQYIIDSGEKQNSDGTTYSSGGLWYVPVYAKDSAYDQSSKATGLRVMVNAAGADANLTAGNIKSGVTILGVTGSYSPSVSPTITNVDDYVNVEPSGISSLGTYTPTSNPNWYVITAEAGGTTKPYKICIDGTTIWNAAKEVGKGLVKLNNPYWQYNGDTVDAGGYNTNKITVTTDGRPEQLSKSETIFLNVNASGQWSSNHQKNIYVQRNNASGEHIAIGSVNASSVYDEGFDYNGTTHHDMHIYGSSYATVYSESVTNIIPRGVTWTVYPAFKKKSSASVASDNDLVWGNAVSFKAESGIPVPMTCTSKTRVNPSSNIYNYTFTAQAASFIDEGASRTFYYF